MKLNIATINTTDSYILAIPDEKTFRLTIQHLSNLGLKWGSGDPADRFEPFIPFKPFTLWVDKGTLFYDSGIDRQAIELETFPQRGRKKKYPRVRVDHTPANYIFGDLTRPNRIAYFKKLTVSMLVCNDYNMDTSEIVVQLHKFKPRQTAIIPTLEGTLELAPDSMGPNVYSDGFFTAIVDDQGNIVNTNAPVLGKKAYSLPKILAVYAARRVNHYGATTWTALSYRDYFKTQSVLLLQRTLYNLARGVEMRTMQRIKEGTYFPVPKNFPTKSGTGVHLSTLDDKLLAYYPSDRHILDDLPQRIKPGRYLKKYFPDMDDDTIRLCSARIMAGSGLKTFSKSSDMFAMYMELKNSGIVESCMSKDRWNRHPLDVYDNSDVELAVLMEFGEPKARALYNKKNKQFPMIYGQWEKMKVLLEANGFKHGPLDGARINKIPLGGDRILMPYIDGLRPLNRSEVRSTYVDVYDDHCIITANGKYNANQYESASIYVDGVGDEPEVYECQHCGDDYTEGDGYFIEWDDITVCRYCYDNDTVELYVDRRSQPVIAIYSDEYYIVNDRVYADTEALEYHGFTEIRGEWYDTDDCVFLEDENIHELKSEIGKSIFAVDEQYYSLDYMLNFGLILSDKIIFEGDEGVPLDEAKATFTTPPEFLEFIWDKLPEPSSLAA